MLCYICYITCNVMLGLCYVIEHVMLYNMLFYVKLYNMLCYVIWHVICYITCYVIEHVMLRYIRCYITCHVIYAFLSSLSNISINQLHCMSSFTGLIFKEIPPYGVKWLRAKAQSRLYCNINILLSEKHTLNISPGMVSAQKAPKQNYIYLCIRSTTIRIREVGKRGGGG